jgi:hypothetical protein
VGHFGGGDAQNAVGGRNEIESERLGDPRFERTPGAVDIELDLAAKKSIDAQPSEDEIGIGDSRLGAAEPVTHGARLGTRAFRSHMQCAHVHARD